MHDNSDIEGIIRPDPYNSDLRTLSSNLLKLDGDRTLSGGTLDDLKKIFQRQAAKDSSGGCGCGC
ncbi:MAG: hypothetical protein HC852_16545 [Acaryochloridaceae cyanobacterium RU_4_10]|nr:hypothetical protein [Acaryochloridaceae cyanobacterium RU_4_10]